MGKCAVCGEDFCAGVIKDLMGMASGITSFNVGFVEQTLYAHEPECVEAVKQAFDTAVPEDAVTVHSRLPDGPLKSCLHDALKARDHDEQGAK